MSNEKIKNQNRDNADSLAKKRSRVNNSIKYVIRSYTVIK